MMPDPSPLPFTVALIAGVGVWVWTADAVVGAVAFLGLLWAQSVVFEAVGMAEAGKDRRAAAIEAARERRQREAVEAIRQDGMP